MAPEVVMNIGDTVVCVATRGYAFTEGKKYTVLSYEEAGSDGYNPFVWPAYVTVTDDYGRPAHCHASRFTHLLETK